MSAPFRGSRFGRSRSRGHHSGKPSFQSHRSHAQRGKKPFRGDQIHHSKYVNKAVVAQAETKIQIKNSFSDFAFEPELLRNVIEHGYTTPTPIQDQAIPLILGGRDVVGFAQTGTGKTAAFLLPLINKVLKDKDQGVLIVVPTRELAVQILDELKIFTANLPISKTLCVGGQSMKAQIHALRGAPHFVIGTPGRLKDLVMNKHLKLGLFTNIVLDEVDRMLDIGFVRDIRFLVDQLPKKRQSLFFSATITREAQLVMDSFCPDPSIVRIPSRETSSQVDQDIVRIVPGKSKADTLTELLVQSEFERVIVFGRTKHGVNKLEAVLTERGIKVSSIHGNKSQNARQHSLRLFKSGSVQVLLATDVAARGIDIENVSHVINYDEPATYEDYIHRIGRTGRANKVGKALTFVG